MPKDEKQSFEYYYSKSYTQAYGYILKKISNPQAAEDLLMDAFLACYQNFDRYDPEKASFQTWLYVIINNKLKNYYRDRKEFDDIDDCMEFTDSFEDDLIAAARIKEMRDTFCLALSILPEIQKSIVVMKYVEKMQAKDIGEKLGLTPGNVRVQLSRALEKIRMHFDASGITWDF